MKVYIVLILAQFIVKYTTQVWSLYYMTYLLTGLCYRPLPILSPTCESNPTQITGKSLIVSCIVNRCKTKASVKNKIAQQVPHPLTLPVVQNLQSCILWMQGSMMQRVTNMEMFKLSYWNPAKDMKGVLSDIKAFLQQWARYILSKFHSFCITYLTTVA